MRIRIGLLLFLLLALHSWGKAAVETWRSAAGDHLAFDGTWYSFYAGDGPQAFKLWTPPGSGPIRGLILFGNPGGDFSGDTRSKAHDRGLLEFAARHHCAVAGVTAFPGRRTLDELGVKILRGLEAMGAHGRHPELARVPFLVTGGSNAGRFAYAMLCLAPERTIAITPNVGGYHDAPPPPAARTVPAWIHIGALDELSLLGVESTEKLFHAQGGPDLLWTWDAELKGHENRGADHVDVAFWDTVLPLRLPSSVPRTGAPVALRTLDPSSGWYADFRTWDHRITGIVPAAALPADWERGRYGWLPSEGLARLYQANATRSRPLLLKIREAAAAPGKGTSGVYLSADSSLVAAPGAVLHLSVETKPLAFGIRTVRIMDQAEVLGEVTLPESPNFTLTVDGSKRVHALYAYAEDQRGNPRISPPVQVVVRDPTLSEQIAGQLAQARLAQRFQREAVAPRPPAKVDARAALPRLEASPWAAGDATDRPRRDGVRSPLWDRLEMTRPLELGPAHRVGVAAEKPDAGTRVAVQAHWDAAGLYFCFRVSAPDFSPEGEGMASAIDFHLANLDPAGLLETPASPDIYASPVVTNLLRHALQIQSPLLTSGDAAILSVNFWDPWDCRSETWTAVDAFAGTGAWVDVIAEGAGGRSVELFLPWTLAGRPGLKTAPQAGAEFVLALGYNDVAGRPKLVWPSGLDPWRQPVASDPAALPVYGVLRLR